jgi:hypothetical protein
MSDKEEWEEWQIHDGKGCPCVGKFVRAVFLDGSQMDAIAGSYPAGPPQIFGSSWVWGSGAIDIIRYRIRKPRALMDLIELVENLPAPVGPKVDA